MRRHGAIKQEQRHAPAICSVVAKPILVTVTCSAPYSTQLGVCELVCQLWGRRPHTAHRYGKPQRPACCTEFGLKVLVPRDETRLANWQHRIIPKLGTAQALELGTPATIIWLRRPAPGRFRSLFAFAPRCTRFHGAIVAFPRGEIRAPARELLDDVPNPLPEGREGCRVEASAWPPLRFRSRPCLPNLDTVIFNKCLFEDKLCKNHPREGRS